jgi:hypothetical protein
MVGPSAIPKVYKEVGGRATVLRPLKSQSPEWGGFRWYVQVTGIRLVEFMYGVGVPSCLDDPHEDAYAFSGVD